MALMNCPECNSQVSSVAVSCPHCGAPISSGGQAIGVPLTTVQETSKRLKIQIILSSLMAIIGSMKFFKGYFFGDLYIDQSNFLFTMFLFIGGTIWFLTTKFRIWWHHK